MNTANLNNLSKKFFKEFCKNNNVVPDGNRNVFIDSNGEKWGWTIDFNNPSSYRQFYDDCVGLYVGEKQYLREELTFNSISRISPTHGVAFNVSF